MYIKQIVIQGFKSYKEQTAMDPLSRGLNVVVGRNGSGKSNFFWAIRFVLGDAYNSMTREERQSLLHEGNGPATISAFVEIIFDNSDNRFPTGKEEVILRRTIGIKKDEYSLDKKSVTKSEVMSLLESAGFSRLNPYYIVPQGRITWLTHAKDHDRYQLIQDVSGTKVYEQRRQESIKILDETRVKQAKIDELLLYIDERLNKLEEERDQLDVFLERDKQRRCVEYSIYSREQRDAVEALTELEMRHNEDMETSLTEFNALNELDQVAQGIEDGIQKNETKLRSLVAERQQVEEEYQEYVRDRAQLELVVRDQQDSAQMNVRRKEEIRAEVQRLADQVKTKTAELDEVTPEYVEACAAETAAKAELEKNQLELEGLQSKAGRAAQFRNARDRDRWLRETIASLASSAREEQSQVERLEQDLEQARARDRELTNEITTAQTDLARIKTDMETVDAEFSRLRRQREELEQQRKKLWKEEATLSSGLDGVREDVQRCERTLFGSMDRASSQGLLSVKKIVQRLKLTGVYGPLYELFRVNEGCRVAVDVIASSSLFHVVVDTDETATRILEELNRERGGRVTFMPLNRLKAKEPQYPETDQARPMLEVLEYDRMFHKAFVQVFGKAMICQSLEVGSMIAREHGLTAVTLEGDRADRKGALSGGYRDQRQLRLEAAQRMKVAQERMNEMDANLVRVKSEIECHNQIVTRTRDEMSGVENRRREIMSRRGPLTSEIRSKMDEQTQIQEVILRRERSVVALKENISVLDGQMKAHGAEIGTALVSKLSDSEQKRMRALIGRLDTDRKKFSEAKNRRVEIEGVKSSIEIELQSRLKRMYVEACGRLESVEDEQAVSGGHRGLDSVEERISSASGRIAVIDAEVDKIKRDVAGGHRELEKIRTDQSERRIRVERQQRRTEKFMGHRSVLVKKREEASRRIADLGVLPSEAFSEYADESVDRLLQRLHSINVHLRECGQVNRKAHEQFVHFRQQKEQLEGRKRELEESRDAITDMISVLDGRKEEAIQRTFDDVNRHFGEIWAELIPGGRGWLERSEADGVSMQVSFGAGGDSGESQSVRVSQLSGGQKSLVALSLIFALQRTDPFPFYLFDEIDSFLDSNHRQAVSRLISHLSQHAQFITTTFKPELLAYANAFYGITFNNKLSSIHSISREQASQFIHNSH